MKTKLTLIVAGALAALAFAALPAVATAGEFNADCETGNTCSAVIEGGEANLRNTNNERISCTSVEGTATQNNNSPTGTAALTFTGCREHVTFFTFSCNSPGTPAGVIHTNTMVTHLVYIDPSASTPGVLLTGANVTFECTGFAKKTVTGNIIGHWTNPQCGSFSASHTVTFEQASAGNQKYTQVTTTGTVFDLISNNDNGGTYLTSSQTGSGTLTAENGNNAKFTC